nr:hypothetical protein [Tanacetum cinerariifolium]
GIDQDDPPLLVEHQQPLIKAVDDALHPVALGHEAGHRGAAVLL